MNRKIVCSSLILVVFMLFSCQKRVDVEEFNEDLIEIVKTNSIYSNYIDWKVLIKEIDSITKTSKEENLQLVTATHVIKSLRDVGDNHSFYMKKNTEEDVKVKFPENQDPEGKMLAEDVVYIKIPGFVSGLLSEQNKYASNIQLLIKSLDSGNIKGWIIDLRDNWGGSMYPMIVGLGPLYEEGVLGYFILQNGKKASWSYKNGKSSWVSVENPYVIQRKNFKIAVLINKNTSSSGEMTAISFIGQQNVKLIGASTGGFTTGNAPFVLKDGSCIHLASARVADRNLNMINGSIIPDMVIQDYLGSDDNSVDAAIEWIRENE
jgi:C-terminal processing protease CtpA/Prc